MGAVTSQLSPQQETKLCKLLGRTKLSLLYKASAHGFHSSYFHNKCDGQGPTVIVAYNNSGYVFGAYTSKDYGQTGQDIIDDEAFLFSLGEGDKPFLRVSSSKAQFAFNDGNAGPDFGSLVFLHNNTASVYSKPGTYNFDPVEMHGDDLKLTECEVYKVEGAVLLMEKPWRNIDWNVENRKNLMEKISKWSPSTNLSQKARVLLVGPVRAGKSSFYNSVSSIFKGYMNYQANTGTTSTTGTGLTNQFRVYSIKAGGKELPITLCDSMGLEAGLDINDFTSILKGHIKDRYQFNPSLPVQVDSPYYCEAPGLKDRIHAVVYVMDATKIKVLPESMLQKLAAFRTKANQMGVPQMVLLTKVDEACSFVSEDLKCVYRSPYIHKLIQDASVNLGVSVSAVVPVMNYSKELDLDPQIDILLLSAVIQILRVAEAFFDDVTSEEVKAAN